MNILTLLYPILQQANEISWDGWSLLVQLPFLLFFAWYIERRDAQFLKRIDALVESLNCLEKKWAEMATASAVAEKLADEFWGRGDGKVR